MINCSKCSVICEGKWINIQDQEPIPGEKILFFYDKNIHMGSLVYCGLRPIKWKLDCDCCGYLDLEIIEYCESDAEIIQWWMPLPEFPTQEGLFK